MFKDKKKDTRAKSINCVFMSMGVDLVSFVVNVGHNSHRFLFFFFLFVCLFFFVSYEQVNTEWE